MLQILCVSGAFMPIYTLYQNREPCSLWHRPTSGFMPATKATVMLPSPRSSPAHLKTTLKPPQPAAATITAMGLATKRVDAVAMDTTAMQKRVAAVTVTNKRANAAAAVTANAAKKNATATEQAIADAAGMDMATVTAAAENTDRFL